MSQNVNDTRHEFETVRFPQNPEAILSKMEVPTRQTVE